MLNKDELKKLQRLVKIHYSPEEEKIFLDKLTGIMGVIDQLQDIECSDIEPLRSVSEATQRLVKDEVTETDISDQLFASVPKQGQELAREVKCFVVPKVVE